MRNIFTLLVVALISACTFSAYAAIVEGTCGDNLTWVLNSKDSTLVISGEGEMENNPSWSEYTSFIKYISLSDGLTNIGNSAFAYCSGLTSITIPNSVTSIGSSAFACCSGLTSITIPNGVTNIGDSAFYWCSGLTSITIPNSVTTMGNYAFYHCPSLTSVTIGNSVTSIGNNAFEECRGLTSIEIPNSVTSIGDDAFMYCSELTSVTIGNSVASIGSWAFFSCYNLTSITIPNSVTSIGELAFSECFYLTSVTMGNSVASIGSGAFNRCRQIQQVTSYAPVPPSAVSCDINPAITTLYVPAEYIATYSNAIWWEDFKEIRAIDADYLVTFLDWDGTTLATAGVTAGKAATAPDAPTREGYTFVGWDSDFSCVIEDMTVTAQYQINRYQVCFLDWDEKVIKTDSVDYQSVATAPADPTRAGYTFIGWDKDFSSITADLDVYALYEVGEDKEFAVVFSDKESNEISTQSVTIKVPLAPEIEGFTFLYWQTLKARLDNVITIQAVYENNVPSAAPNVYINPANKAQKLIRDGNVYILHDEKTYTITGQMIQ